MKPRAYKAVLIRLHELAENIRQLDLKLIEPPSMEFKAGQYVLVRTSEAADRPTYRAYSLASSPLEKRKIALLVKLFPGGEGSTFIERLKPNQRLMLRGPAGRFTLDERSAQDILFVAHETGIGLIKSMISYLLEKGEQRQLTVFYGCQREEELVYSRELQSMAKAHKNLSPIFVLSSETRNWTGERGSIAEVLQRRITSVENTNAYLCGFGPEIQNAANVLVSKGLPQVRIRTEDFARSAKSR